MEATRQPHLQEIMRFTKVRLTVWFNSLTTFYNKCFPWESILFLEVSCSSLDLSEFMQKVGSNWNTWHQTLFYFWKNNDVLQTHSVCGPLGVAQLVIATFMFSLLDIHGQNMAPGPNLAFIPSKASMWHPQRKVQHPNKFYKGKWRQWFCAAVSKVSSIGELFTFGCKDVGRK